MFTPTLAAVTTLGRNAYRVARKNDSLKFYHPVANQAVGPAMEDAIRTLLQAGAKVKVKDVGRIYHPALAEDGETVIWNARRGWSTVRVDYTVFQVRL